jgi:hypothetical protein
MFDFIKNKTVFANKYKTHSEAMIVSCFFNPQNSPYRIKSFNKFYDSIKHLNHQIIECIIGDAEPQLEESENIKRVYTDNILWHKEALLNKLISELPKKYKYIFWIDADVIFTNLNWVVEGVEQLKVKNIIQPFEYCVHLERDETKPSFYMDRITESYLPNKINSKVWRSFCSNYADNSNWQSEIYNNHGHVGFAWAAKREILEAVPLYDKALIGGADHIIAHAAAGQIAHSCITKSFTDNLEEVNDWSRKFYEVAKGNIGYVKGELYHIWHGDIDKRQYLKRIQDFTAKTKQIVHKDKNGLYITNKVDDKYMKDYFRHREVCSEDDGFLTSMALGYMTDSTLLGTALGGNVMGAMIGDMLNDSDSNKQFNGFGGGSSGGAGASGTWDNSENKEAENLDIDNNLQPFS